MRVRVDVLGNTICDRRRLGLVTLSPDTGTRAAEATVPASRMLSRNGFIRGSWSGGGRLRTAAWGLPTARAPFTTRAAVGCRLSSAWGQCSFPPDLAGTGDVLAL